ncbi:MAG: FtsX-like permease family protein [Nitrospirota bacterium]
MKFLKLIELFVIRNIREDRFLTLLSIIGVALGIGLFIGVKVASDRAIITFESDIKGINPYASYEIADISGIDFDEHVYRDVRSIEENTFPVLKINGYLPDMKETIDINGIYTLKAARFLKLSPQKNIDIEDFFGKTNGILMTKGFSEKYSLKKGDVLKPLVYDREYTLKIIDILDLASLPENTVIMDLGNFQEFFGKSGYLSRIDLSTDDERVEKIRELLPLNLSIEKKGEVIRNQKSLVASFRYNLQFISLIAILVGIFLLYNTIFISVLKRRTEIGILRGLGADKKTVVMLFIIQGLVLGFIGSVFGIFLGQVAAYFSVMAVEKTISTMYSTVSISDYFISKGDAAVALILGLFISLMASLIPSFESAKIRPNESMREGTFESRFRGYQKFFAIAGVLSIICGGILSCLDYYYVPFDFPFLAYIGILFIIIGFTFISPLYLSAILRIIKKQTEKIFKATGKISLGDLKGNVYRFSVALMSVAISSALVIALFILIFSFRNSLKVWINRNVTADIYIKPSSCLSNYCFYPMSEEVYEAVKDFPEVKAIDRFRTLQIKLFGKKVTAAFADVEVRRKYSGLKYFDNRYYEHLKEIEQAKVVSISDYLGVKYGLKEGDTIEIETPGGKKTFTIGDVSSSYSTTAGFVYMDRKWLKEYWGLDDTTQMSIYVKDGVDIDRFIQKLKERLSRQYSLEIMNNRELRQKVLSIFNKSFAITYAIEVISIIVSLMGVINTLLALVLERKRDISIIRYLGGRWKQIQDILVLSAGIVGITGIFLGTLMGLLMSIILIQVVNKISFGWAIVFRVPVSYLSLISMLLFLTTLIAGLIPSRVARKIDPRRFISFE